MGKQNCVKQFFRCVVRADFFETTKVGRNVVNFWPIMVQKGVQPSSPQERFTFVRREAMSKVQKLTLCQRVTETPAKSRL